MNRTELNYCVFLARYRKRGVNQWVRFGQPEIEVGDVVRCDMYREPQLEVVGDGEIHVRVRDDAALNLQADNLLGNYHAAARRCHTGFLQDLAGHVIVDSLSAWLPDPE